MTTDSSEDHIWAEEGCIMLHLRRVENGGLCIEIVDVQRQSAPVVLGSATIAGYRQKRIADLCLVDHPYNVLRSTVPDRHGPGGKVMSITHDLKCERHYYRLVKSGEKPFELRLNDRCYQKGDYALLREVDGRLGYTGNELLMEITCVVSGLPWLQPNYVAFGIRPLTAQKINVPHNPESER